METRNSTTLASFVDYCKKHPEERFWQALRNWSGYRFIMAYDIKGNDERVGHDTFYIENRRHDDK